MQQNKNLSEKFRSSLEKATMKSLSYRLDSRWKEEKVRRTDLWAHLDPPQAKHSQYANTVCIPGVNHVLIFILYIDIDPELLDPELIVLVSYIL